MRKTYLLAGSIGLLGAIAQVFPALATTDPTVQVQTTASALSTPTVSETQTATTGPDLSTVVAGEVLNAGTSETLMAQQLPASEPSAPAPAILPGPPPISVSQQQTFPDSSTVAQGAPVTSVSQLSDVDPNNWAFQALQSLIERYGCIAGYPDGTFRGNRALTRYEFAAGLYACLNSLAERIQGLSPDDLATLRRLQEEFAAELATLRGRVDALEARTTELEANQFSTTTKLQGEVVFAPQYGEQVGLADGSRATFITRARLNFNTSFSGSDLLQTQLELGNGGQDLIGNRVLGAPLSTVNPVTVTDPATVNAQTQDLNLTNNGLSLPLNLTALGLRPATVLNNLGRTLTQEQINALTQNGANAEADGFLAAPYFVDLGSIDYSLVGGSTGSPLLRRLAYTFKLGDDLAITVGPRIFPSDFVDFNSYANNSAQDFSSGFFINNPLVITNAVDIAGGAGAAIDYNFGGGPLTFRAVYVAASPTNALTNAFGGGLFGDPYQATGEIEFSPSDAFAVRFHYTTASITNFKYSTYGVNAEATLGRFGIFGRYGRGDIDGYGFFQGVEFSDLQTFMAGVGVRDIFTPGSLLAVAVGHPIFGGGTGSLFGDNTQTNYEGFYRFAINDNITVTPAVMIISNPNSAAGGNENTIYQGVLRTTFSF